MEKKKLLIIVTPLTSKGGTIRRLVLWSRYLQPYFEIQILFNYEDHLAKKLLEKEGIVTCCLKLLNKPGRLLIIPALRGIIREIHEFRPDVVVSMFVWSDFLSLCSLELYNSFYGVNLRHIVHVAGSPVPPVNSSLLKNLYRNMTRKVMQNADKVICICNHDREMLISQYRAPMNRVTMIPIGIEISPYNNTRRIRKPVTFGVMSLLTPVKNVGAIISAYKKVCEEFSDGHELIIYGDGSERNSLEKISFELGLDDFITFKGWYKDPVEAFDKIDCLLSFSQKEGVPRSMLEAASRGVPTIARPVGGVTDIVKENVTGYTVDTISDMTQKILDLIKCPDEILRMGKNARTLVEEKFSIEAEIHKIKSLLNE